MESKFLVIPGTCQKLTEGTVVMLSSSDIKYVVHQGWYIYNNQQCQGWYFSSIPSNQVLPAIEVDLNSVTIVSYGTSGQCDCRPRPPLPDTNRFSKQDAYELRRAWISVDTIALRNELNKRLLPDGKVVRVNRATADGKPKYFIWNQVTETWDDFIIGSESEDVLTKEEADTLYASKSIETDIDETVKSISEEIVPDIVSEYIQNDTTMIQMKERLNTVESNQEWKTISEETA